MRSAWLEAAAHELHGRTSRGELEREQGEILDALLDGLRAGGVSLAEPAFDQLRGILADVSSARARLGFTPRETAIGVFALKEGLYRLDSATGADTDVTPLLRLVDQLGLFTFETFAAAREGIIAEQAEQLLELSTPVVKLWEGIVAVPLVGTLDSARTQVVMEKLLNTLVDTGSEHAIIDITGVPAVDTQVAQHLLKTVVAARLMGPSARSAASARRSRRRSSRSVSSSATSARARPSPTPSSTRCARAGTPAGPGSPHDRRRPHPQDRLDAPRLDPDRPPGRHGAAAPGGPRAADHRHRCARRDHRHLRAGDRRLVHRPHARVGRRHLARARRDDGRRGHAPGRRHHDGRARAVARRRPHRAGRRARPRAPRPEERSAEDVLLAAAEREER